MQLRNHRGLTLALTLLVLVAPSLSFYSPASAAQNTRPAGVVVRDITFESGCSLTYRTYATRDFNSAVVDEQEWECPAGTIVETKTVYSEEKARSLGGIFVPVANGGQYPHQAVADAEAELSPTSARSYAQERVAALGCVERGFSRTLYYETPPNSGFAVTSVVYYYQDSFCNQGLSSAVAWINQPHGDLRWNFANYPPAPYPFSHGCRVHTTSGLSDRYDVQAPLGGLYTDESALPDPNWPPKPPCSAWATAYSDRTRL